LGDPGPYTSRLPLQIGLRFPQLERLRLRGPMDIDAMSTVEAPIFPALLGLSLDGWRDYEETDRM
jgi:hypothetical protein